MKKLAVAYNEFQHNYGTSEELDYDGIINQLFARHFKKIANGKELVGKRDELLAQLSGVKAFAGNWKIEPIFTIVSDCNKKCTIRYILSSEKAASFDIIAVITADDEGKIEFIDEVFYQI